jgi:hypothetical protein
VAKDLRQLSFWDYVPPESDVVPIPTGFDGTPIYYSETGFVLREPRKLVCGGCGKIWHTIRPEVHVWQCDPTTCFFANRAAFVTTLPEQIKDEDDGEAEED